MKKDYYYLCNCQDKVDAFIKQGKYKLAKKYYNKLWRLIKLKTKRTNGNILYEDFIDFIDLTLCGNYILEITPSFEQYLEYRKEKENERN